MVVGSSLYVCVCLLCCTVTTSYMYVVCWLIGGLETESEYPYKGDDEKCTFVRQEARVYINGSVNISKNEDGRPMLCVFGFLLRCLSYCEKYINFLV